MPRTFSSYSISNLAGLKKKLVAWADGYQICAILDSCGYQLPHKKYELIAGVGALRYLPEGTDPYDQLSAFDAANDDWIFGHLEFEAPQVKPNKSSGTSFPACFFFVPEIVVEIKNDRLHIGTTDGKNDEVYDKILSTSTAPHTLYQASFKAALSRENYVEAVSSLQKHIRRGDCYEINFCQEFYAEGIIIDPSDLFDQLNEYSPNPFSAFYKYHDQYALCASPERYVQKAGSELICQPIKGTAGRSGADAAIDAASRLALQQSEKDRRENVIVVDLVRNDMSRVCEAGTVMVEELFGIYDFPMVFQMISTIRGNLAPDKNLAKVLQASFPMGSMTGAPKKKVLELIEEYEPSKRGLYSGTIGYINPEKDFDFNVVIRTLLYNSSTGYLGYFAGAGITDMSDPEQEYEECLLKAAVLQQLFNKSA